jgi:hypothetical protein
MKRYNILVHTFRNRLKCFEDDVIGICAGLWNLVLSYLIIPHCQMFPKFLKLLKKGHENVSRETLGNRVPDSICA